MLQIQLAVLAVAATTLVLSGCGGSSNKSGSTSTAAATSSATTTAAEPAATQVKVATGKPLSRAQFIATADAICARTNTKLSTVSVVTTKEFARVLPQVAIYDGNETNELSKLVPPASMAHVWAQMLSDLQLHSEYTSKVAQYAQANNLKAATPTILSADRLRQQLDVIAVRNGFKHCSKQGGGR